MNSRDALVRALANAAPDEPDTIVGAALELAIAEIDLLTTELTGSDEHRRLMLLGCAIEGRLRALDAFIGENVKISWKPGREPVGGES